MITLADYFPFFLGVYGWKADQFLATKKIDDPKGPNGN